MKLPKLLTFSLVLLLTACGSTPRSNYYLLSGEVQGEISGTSPAIGVGPVSTPAYLNRSDMVFRSSRNQLSIAEFDRWAEPLDSGINRVVAINLAILLDTQSVKSFPWRREEQPEYAVRVNLVRLDTDKVVAELVAEWSLVRPSDDEILERKLANYKTTLNDPEPVDIAKAYSMLLKELSEDIAARIRVHHSSGTES